MEEELAFNDLLETNDNAVKVLATRHRMVATRFHSYRKRGLNQYHAHFAGAFFGCPLSGVPYDRRGERQTAVEDRYVKLYIATPMYRSQLCIGRTGRNC